jgi:hypothetical protein
MARYVQIASAHAAGSLREQGHEAPLDGITCLLVYHDHRLESEDAEDSGAR